MPDCTHLLAYLSSKRVVELSATTYDVYAGNDLLHTVIHLHSSTGTCACGADNSTALSIRQVTSTQQHMLTACN